MDGAHLSVCAPQYLSAGTYHHVSKNQCRGQCCHTWISPKASLSVLISPAYADPSAIGQALAVLPFRHDPAVSATSMFLKASDAINPWVPRTILAVVAKLRLVFCRYEAVGQQCLVAPNLDNEFDEVYEEVDSDLAQAESEIKRLEEACGRLRTTAEVRDDALATDAAGPSIGSVGNAKTGLIDPNKRNLLSE